MLCSSRELQQNHLKYGKLCIGIAIVNSFLSVQSLHTLDSKYKMGEVGGRLAIIMVYEDIHSMESLALFSLWNTSSMMVQTGSVGLNHLELMWNFPISLVLSVKYQFYDDSNRFGRIEPPWTDVKLPHYPCSLCDILVQYWFDKVRESRTNSNCCETCPQALFLLWYTASIRYGRVKPTRTDKKLPH